MGDDLSVEPAKVALALARDQFDGSLAVQGLGFDLGVAVLGSGGIGKGQA